MSCMIPRAWFVNDIYCLASEQMIIAWMMIWWKQILYDILRSCIAWEMSFMYMGHVLIILLWEYKWTEAYGFARHDMSFNT